MYEETKTTVIHHCIIEFSESKYTIHGQLYVIYYCSSSRKLYRYSVLLDVYILSPWLITCDCVRLDYLAPQADYSLNIWLLPTIIFCKYIPCAIYNIRQEQKQPQWACKPVEIVLLPNSNYVEFKHGTYLVLYTGITAM